ncbi:MAG TPA: PAS domain S-box protein [Xanthobacteraceae bacterium]
MIQGSEWLEALPVAVYTTDAEGRITFFNQAAADLWGHRPELGSDQWCGSWRLYWPDGRPLPHDQCPMAVTLREGRPVRGIEAILERPDGTRVNFLPCPTPIWDASGRLTGAINLLMDITERHQAQIESARLASIVMSSDDAIVSKSLDGLVTSWNAAATRIFGYQHNEIIGQSIMRIIPPELHDEEKRILAQLARGERIEHFETVRVAKDGRRVEVSLSVAALRDRFGKVIGASKVARDITERKRAEKLQQLLLEELNHRVKNTLATVQAIASQSLLRSQSPAHFVAAFSGRIQALAQAHTLLTREMLRGADVGAIVCDQVLLGSATDERISCVGPAITLNSQAAVQLALVLHELGTNARKYGALSVPNGRLSIGWRMRTDEKDHFLLDWKESHGPKVSVPSGHGFGTMLIEETLRALGGEAVIHYYADGVTCEMALPLPQESRMPAIPPFAVPQAASVDTLPEHPINQSLKGKRVLIVEDEPLLSMEMEASLAEAGCEIKGPAATLATAREMIASLDYDAALLDANLAGQTVEELAAALTQRNVPFAFVTGYGREALPQGFRDAIMLGKPFGKQQLRAVVQSLLYRGADVVRLRQKKV